jgi:hypothetical protein
VSPDQPVTSPEPDRQDNPPPPAGSAEEPPTRVHLSVRRAPGSRLRVFLISQAEDGRSLGHRMLEFTGPEARVESDVEFPAPAAFPAPEAKSSTSGQGAQLVGAGEVPPGAPGHGPLPAGDISSGSRGPLPAAPLPVPGQARAPQKTALALRVRDNLQRAARFTWHILASARWGFLLALAVYLATRLIALRAFPMYFFTDEAVQTVLAADFIRDGFRNYAREFLPTYFYNVYQYNLSLSVYIQVLPTLLFGKSVEVTRATAVLFTLIPAVTGGLSIKQFYGSRYAWPAVLMLSIMPAWFLHSRTAFETSLAVSFYAACLYFYLRYRRGHLRSLYITLLFAALAFYTYSPAQMVLAVTAVLLFFSDLRYHLRLPRRVFFNLLGLGALLALPYLRFILEHPDENLRHLQQIGSYWVAQISLLDKLGRYFSEYLAGLNPLYWFFPNSTDLARHVMGSYGHLLVFSLPFVAWGLVIAIKNFRSSAYRLLLIAVIAAPSGAALAGLGITRALFMVIPGALLAALGLSGLIEWLVRRWQARRKAAAAAIFLLLAGFNCFLLGDALTAGRTWSTDYGLNGMQYGASQVFSEILNYHQQSPDTKLVLSPSWANGTDVVARFFLPDRFPIQIAGIDTYLTERQPLDDSYLFILPVEEYQRALDSSKMVLTKIEKILPWPDGEAGFFFVRLRYADDADAIFAQELEARKAIKQETLKVGRDFLTVHYSTLDMGPIQNLFDGDPNTLIRTAMANPLILQIDFPAAKQMSGITLRIGGTPSTLDVAVQVTGEDSARTYHQEYGADPLPRPVEIDFGAPLEVSTLYIKLKNTYDPEPGHVHLWEVSWK